MRICFLSVLIFLAACRFPKYTVDKLQKDENLIKEAAKAVLQSGIKSASADTLRSEGLTEKLRSLNSDFFEVFHTDHHKFKKPNEPLDSIVVFSRIRKSSVLMWGGEDIIYDFSKRARTYPDYFEDDGYQFRKTGDRIYYRRYYFRNL